MMHLQFVGSSDDWHRWMHAYKTVIYTLLALFLKNILSWLECHLKCYKEIEQPAFLFQVDVLENSEVLEETKLAC